MIRLIPRPALKLHAFKWPVAVLQPFSNSQPRRQAEAKGYESRHERATMAYFCELWKPSGLSLPLVDSVGIIRCFCANNSPYQTRRPSSIPK